MTRTSTQVAPVIYLATATSIQIREDDIPKAPQNGITGYLFAEASAAGASPNEVQVDIEFDEYPSGGTPTTSG